MNTQSVPMDVPGQKSAAAERLYKTDKKFLSGFMTSFGKNGRSGLDRVTILELLGSQATPEL